METALEIYAETITGSPRQGYPPEMVRLDSVHQLIGRHPDAKVIDLSIPTVRNSFFRRYFPKMETIQQEQEVTFFQSVLSRLGLIGDSIEKWMSKCVAVYYHIMDKIIIYPPEKILHAALTSSNRGFLTDEMIGRMYRKEFGVAVAGLSVGAETVMLLHMLGIRSITAADADIVEVHNLNRLALSPEYVGHSKAAALLEWVFSRYPYGNYDFRSSFIDERTIKWFLGDPTQKYVIDAVDDTNAKALLRREAKAMGKTVIMATDMNGTVLVDIERPEVADFNGRPEIYVNSWENMSRPAQVVSAVGLDNVPLDMLKAFIAVAKKELPSFPQPGFTVALSSAVAAWAVIQLEMGVDLPPQMLINLDEIAGVLTTASNEAATRLRTGIEHQLNLSRRTT